MHAASKYLLGFVVVLAMIPPHLSPAQNPRSAGFSLYTHAFLDAERRSSIMVNVNVPYTSLIFLKRGAAFKSDYTVYIKVLNKKKKLVQTAVINEQVVVAEYAATRSAKTSSRSSKRIQLEPGDSAVPAASTGSMGSGSRGSLARTHNAQAPSSANSPSRA